ncbi:MAG TPA: TIGR02147 family protein [bacterium]|nr:TIGR02147 family protein [bacterium]
MTDLFDYTDYRLYLRDWLEDSKGRKGFSQRRFSLRAGLGSPSYLKMVIEGERNLGVAALKGFIFALKLTGEERLYFRSLVLWNQAEDDVERARFAGRLDLLRKFRRASPQAVPGIQRRIEDVRAEIANMLAPEFTPDEAAYLARQFLPESWSAL